MLSLEEFYRREREGSERAQRGGWRVWIWGILVLIVMFAAFFAVVSTADHKLQTEKDLRDANRQDHSIR